jgi:processive 1,2-diacylglycerol beta-glucosyltransferase
VSIPASTIQTPDAGRVLCLTASVGSGHTRAAQAVAAWATKRAAEGSMTLGSIRVEDVLAHAHPVFRSIYRGGYLGMIQRMPTLLGWMYDKLDRPWHGRQARFRVNHPCLAPLRDLLARERPDTVLCTHFLPSEYLAMLRARGEWDGRLVTVVTDIDVHGMWFCDPCDHFFVAADESARMLELGGIDPSRISVTGIPIDPVFSQPLDRTACRTAHGLPHDRPVILFAWGGAGTGPVRDLFRDLLHLRTPAHIVAIAGRNDSARSALAAIAAEHAGPLTFSILGFTDRMHELMAAADLLVGKPGGLSSSEARAMGLPLVIVAPVPGQEERNAAHLLEWGCAIRCNTPGTLAWRIDRLLADPAALAAMSARARSTATPMAGDLVAKALPAIRAREHASSIRRVG